jgi:flagellar L-ring protein precursor FlgH
MFWLIMFTATTAHAQSSSIYLPPQPSQPLQASESVTPSRPTRHNTLSPTIETYSFTAVTPPQPRFFAVNDLVTIIVRESTTTDFETTLETEKKSEFGGEVSDFPNLDLMKLLQFQLQASKNENPPKLGIKFDSKFEGDGEYATKHEIASRITARVIDIKPNGTIVLEARKFIKSDKESLSLVLTGTCRAEDIDIANTLLSTRLYDLNLVKKHEGELRQAARKGILTKLFDFIFAF